MCCLCLSSSSFISMSLLITSPPVCSRRSSPPLAPTTPTRASPRVTWRPSTKWATWASTSPRSGTLTTLWPQRSPWRTRWGHTIGTVATMALRSQYFYLENVFYCLFLVSFLSWPKAWSSVWTPPLFPTLGKNSPDLHCRHAAVEETDQMSFYDPSNCTKQWKNPSNKLVMEMQKRPKYQF